MHKRCLILVMLGLLLGGAYTPSLADEVLRDPTRPYSAAARVVATAPRFVVNAIIVSPERRVAIVNGQRVGIGGSVDGATVIAIEKDQLVLERDGKQLTVSLNKGAAR